MNLIDIFKALSDHARLKNLEIVKNEDKYIFGIIHETQKSQPTISQRFRILRTKKLEKQWRSGTNIWNAASNDHMYPIIKKIPEMSW